MAFKNIQALPNRIDWKKRNNAIKMYETFIYFYKRNKGFALSKYKDSLAARRFKVEKLMRIMISKYTDESKKYFNVYRKNINRLKNDEKNKILGSSFELLNEGLRRNFRQLYIGEAKWKKIANSYERLEPRVKARLSQAFSLWK